MMPLRWKVLVLAALALAAVALFVSALLFSSASTEAADRRDQNCVLFERMWQADIRRLSASYQYLSDLSPQQRTESINLAVLRNLPRTEADVRAEQPPTYCKGDVGLDDSKFLPVPKRPPELR